MTDTSDVPAQNDLERRHAIGWMTVAVIAYLISFAVADRPTVSGRPTVDLAVFALASAAFVVGAAVVFLQPFKSFSSTVVLIAAAMSVAGWTVLILTDDRWAIATFAIYAVCYSLGIQRGVWLAGFVSVAWGLALVTAGSPGWAVVMPLGVFVISSILATTIDRISGLNQRQTELIAELRSTQRDLVASERSKGVLAERTRMAAEIHDTLAQGFTSIVLLSRAGMRTGDATESLKSIEETAQSNLADARRLIEAIRPPELGTGSLSHALQRQLDSVLPATVKSVLTVDGDPRPLSGAVEVTVLRAAQEALLNIRTHAEAERVELGLAYDEASVTLTAADDGIGLEPGSVHDRGDLTGGQGLMLLARRAESLSGALQVTSPDEGGTRMVLSLPIGQPEAMPEPDTGDDQ